LIAATRAAGSRPRKVSRFSRACRGVSPDERLMRALSVIVKRKHIQSFRLGFGLSGRATSVGPATARLLDMFEANGLSVEARSDAFGAVFDNESDQVP